ncbi:DsbC family protein [Azovibrio restrictus]|uniref:DsbC family protein n=1 Tax=Azovibrio restrictus TaxID=146938 RepID=UPI0026ECCFDF|nr:DsbC family protein [Azovibrio restrictus]
MLKKLFPLLLATGLALPALAQEASVKKAVEAKLGTPVTSVTKSGYLGLYEVYFDGQIIYTDEKVSAILAGNLIDTKSMTSVTEERLKKLNAIKFSDLPLNQAVKHVRGNGKRLIAIFEDPNCGYCKRLAKDMVKLDDVTLYIFLYPILSEDSIKKARQIWCSADQAKAWSDWMVNGKAPTGKDDCDTTAIINNQEMGRKLRITGTPTLFFADGERVGGAIPLNRIEQKLNSIK